MQPSWLLLLLLLLLLPSLLMLHGPVVLQA
jgi:hypothetical protein